MVKDTTSKEEVLLNLGEPDLVLNHERIFVYRWEMVAAYFVVGGIWCRGCRSHSEDQLPHH